MNSLTAVIRDSSATNDIENVFESFIGDRALGRSHFDLSGLKIDFWYVSGVKHRGVKNMGLKNNFRRFSMVKKILLDNKQLVAASVVPRDNIYFM